MYPNFYRYLLCAGLLLPAVQHLLAAKYLIELMGGPRHPELATIYYRLVGIYDELGDYIMAQRCLLVAKRLSPNVAKQCMISATIAEMHDKMGNLALALTEQKGVLRVMEQLFGADDEKTIEAKARVEKFLRKLTVDKLNTARETLALQHQDQQPKKGAGKETILNGDAEEEAVKAKKNGNKKSKKGKK